MADSTLVLDPEMLHDAFHEWQSEQETLEAEWNESLAALVAYQSHLDDWQQQLGRERDELRQSRDQWELERTTTDLSREQSSAQVLAQLAEAQEKVAQLSEQLLARTEDLRQLDQKCAEATGELERTKCQANELAAELDDHKQKLEMAAAAAAGHAQQVQALNDQLAASALAASVANQLPVGPAAVDAAQESAPVPAKLQRKLAGNGGDAKRPANSPVLGSIVEQFGKLRQQRASERQVGKKQG